MKCIIGQTLDQFLADELGLDREYIDRRITTIFLEGSCVDRLDRAVIQYNSVVALSSAMPGLAGASLRRGGFYGGLRDAITYRDGEKNIALREGCVTVKVFNLLMSEMGPLLLRRGIWIKASELLALILQQDGLFRKSIVEIRMGTMAAAIEDFIERMQSSPAEKILVRYSGTKR